MSTFASGFAHSCAISSSGKLYVWGDNKNCQLGHDSNKVCLFLFLIFEGFRVEHTDKSQVKLPREQISCSVCCLWLSFHLGSGL